LKTLTAVRKRGKKKEKEREKGKAESSRGCHCASGRRGGKRAGNVNLLIGIAIGEKNNTGKRKSYSGQKRGRKRGGERGKSGILKQQRKRAREKRKEMGETCFLSPYTHRGKKGPSTFRGRKKEEKKRGKKRGYH